MLAIEDDRAPQDQRERADRVLTLLEGEERVLTFGFTVMNLLLRQVYVWVIPGPALTPMRLRRAKRVWEDGTAAWRTIIIMVRREDPTAVRFARYFGFERVQAYNEEIDFYGIYRTGPVGS
jgi:hypothetical protein